MNSQRDRRYFVVTSDLGTVAGYDTEDGAAAAAIAFGEGTNVVDTNAALYQPMVQQVVDGGLVFLDYGGWGPKPGLDGSLVEAVRKGHPPLALAFLAKGSDPNAADGNGGTALIWAVARGSLPMVEGLLAAGAAVDRADNGGMTALALARRRGNQEIAERLLAAGAR